MIIKLLLVETNFHHLLDTISECHAYVASGNRHREGDELIIMPGPWITIAIHPAFTNAVWPRHAEHALSAIVFTSFHRLQDFRFPYQHTILEFWHQWYRTAQTPAYWGTWSDVMDVIHRIALFWLNVSEKELPPSSGVVVLLGFHTCITAETLLLSLSIERHY
jgi:hypothetical protein